MTTGASVTIEGLVKRYGAHLAVDGVSLAVAPGEFVTLLGASGSGKTTTLMMIAGFAHPDSGAIRIGARDVVGLPPEKRGLGVVFQSYALFPNYDVFENVAFPLRLRRVPRDEIVRRVGEVLERVHLAGLARRRIGQLSGGQQQRVALARAIVFAPPVLLMDEPLGALDRRLRDELQVEIKRIGRDLGVTVIYVTHDQEEALAMSDRIAIMRDGRIVQLGSPDEVYQRPASPFVASFLGESNFVEVRREGPSARGGVGTRTPGPDAIRIVGIPCDPDGGGDALVAAVRPEAIRIASPGDPGENRGRGTVELREFLGVTVRLQVRCPFGLLAVRLPRVGLDPAVGVGQTVELAWNAADTLLFGRR